MTILYTNGCSWTYGGALGLDYDSQTSQRLNSVWPCHLGKLLNAEKVFNLSDGCGSNQRSVRTTYEWVLSQSKETLENTIAIIQFTEPSRHEIYSLFKNDPKNSWIKLKVDNVSSHIRRGNLEYLTPYNEMVLSHYTNEEGVHRTLTYCETLSSLFKKYNVKYFFWNPGFLNHKDIRMFDFKNNTGIDESIAEYFRSFNWFEIDNNYETIINDPHPSLVGHKQIAERIFNNIKDKL